MREKKVLVADDSVTVVQLVQMALEQKGFDVVTAANGLEALEKVFLEKPDVVVLDIMMPYMNGYQVCRLLKNERDTQHIPIVMLTSRARRSDKYWGLKAGANEYMVKPFEPYELCELIERIMMSRKRPPINVSDSELSLKFKHLSDVALSRRKDDGAEKIRLRKSEMAVQLLSRLNELLDDKLYELTIINEVSELIRSIENYDQMMDAVMDKLNKLLDFSVSTLLIVEDTEEKMAISIQRSIGQRFIDMVKNRTLEEYRGYIGEERAFYNLKVKIRTGGDFFIYDGSARTEELKNFFAVPLKVRGRTCGLIAVASHRDNTLPAEQKSTLRLFANHASIILDNARLYSQLKSLSEDKSSKLITLFEVGRMMGSAFDTMNLLNLITDAIVRQLKVRRYSLMLLDEVEENLALRITRGMDEKIVEQVQLSMEENTVSGHVIKTGKPILVQDIRDDALFEPGKGRYQTNSFVCVPILSKNKVIGVLSVTDKKDGTPFGEDDLNLLSTLATQMGQAIESAKLYDMLVEKERMDRELEIARGIQMNWLPKKGPDLPGFDIAGRCEPAKEMSGDYFDFVEIDSDTVGFVVGDVSGKGVPAALTVLMIRSSLRMEAENNRPPEYLMTRLNKMLVQDTEPDQFVTLFYGKLSRSRRELTFTNAGHDFPLIYRTKTGEFDQLESTGLLAGMFEKSQYEQKVVSLHSGDILVVYSDGLTDAINTSGEKYRLDRLKQAIIDHQDLSAEDMIKRMFNDVNRFSKDRDQFDDMTLVIMKVT